MFLRKFKKETNIVFFLISFLKLFSFSVFLLCSLFFIRTFDYHQNKKVAEQTHHKASNINKIINYNYEIMTKIKI